MFKVNNKDTSSVSSVSIVNFEHVIADWVTANSMTFKKADIMRKFDESLSFADFTKSAHCSAILIKDLQISILSLSKYIKFYFP